jgi:hypothetical protein
MANYANFLLDAGSFVESHRVATAVKNSYTNPESKLLRPLKGIKANDRIFGGLKSSEWRKKFGKRMKKIGF